MDFASYGQGIFFDEVYVVGDFVVGDFAFAVVLDVLGGERAGLVGDDPCGELFAEVGVRDADDLDVANSGVG